MQPNEAVEGGWPPLARFAFRRMTQEQQIAFLRDIAPVVRSLLPTDVAAQVELAVAMIKADEGNPQ